MGETETEGEDLDKGDQMITRYYGNRGHQRMTSAGWSPTETMESQWEIIERGLAEIENLRNLSTKTTWQHRRAERLLAEEEELVGAGHAS